MVEEDSAITYYDHWQTVVMHTFQLKESDLLDDSVWVDYVRRWYHLEKNGFLMVKLKKNGS